MEHDQMSKLMVHGGKEQRECSHLIVLRYVDDNVQQEQPITPKQQQQEQPSCSFIKEHDKKRKIMIPDPQTGPKQQ